MLGGSARHVLGSVDGFGAGEGELVGAAHVAQAVELDGAERDRRRHRVVRLHAGCTPKPAASNASRCGRTRSARCDGDVVLDLHQPQAPRRVRERDRRRVRDVVVPEWFGVAPPHCEHHFAVDRSACFHRVVVMAKGDGARMRREAPPSAQRAATRRRCRTRNPARDRVAARRCGTHSALGQGERPPRALGTRQTRTTTWADWWDAGLAAMSPGGRPCASRRWPGGPRRRRR